MTRTRIAPSPTGQDVHVGSIAAALMNFAWAKKNKGQFIIRIEDTDQSRLVPGATEKILDTFDRIGLVADESPKAGGPYEPYRQSERLDIYKKHTEELIAKGKAYYCICSTERLARMREEQQAKKQIPKYDRKCFLNQKEIIKQINENKTPYVIRLLIPKGQTKFNDVVRGEITIDNENLDDQVLLKSDGFPTYHLGVVVDDHLMKISHIIRGEEWLPSTPKHIILYEAFGWPLPVFAHISLLRNPDKSKLSKRKNPVWTSWYLDQGIFPEALLNYLALMGWSHPDGEEIFSLDEYIKVFDLKDIQKTAPVFDPVKLEWMNGEYIRKLNVERLTLNVIRFIGDKFSEETVKKTIPLIHERIKKLADYLPLCEFFFKRPTTYEIDLFSTSSNNNLRAIRQLEESREEKKDLFKKIYEELNKVSSWKADVIGESMLNLAKKLQMKNSEFFMLLRVAVSGKKITPPLNESMEILGKEECLERLNI